MPWHQQHFTGRESVDSVLKITGDEPVRYYGGWDREVYDFTLPVIGHIYKEKKLPAQIPYKVPFYIMAHNGYTMHFDTVANTDTWYISLRKDWLKDTNAILLELPVIWRNSPVVLARKK